MECLHCGSSYEIGGFEYGYMGSYPEVCPFCGCTNADFSNDSARVLKQIIDFEGIGVLLKRKILSALISDLLYMDKKEKVTFKIVVGEGIAELFYDMIDKDESFMKKQKYKIEKLLYDEIGMTEERANHVINSFMYAIGLENNLLIIHPKEKNYKDRDNIYLKLAEEYLKKDDDLMAHELFNLSASAGNLRAIHRVVDLVQEKNWRIDGEDWISWNRQLADEEVDNFKAAYVMAMSYTYGFKVDIDDKTAIDYWEDAQYYNQEAATEYFIRQLMRKLPNRSFQKSFITATSYSAIKAFERYAKSNLEPAHEIYDYMCCGDEGFDGWVNYYMGRCNKAETEEYIEDLYWIAFIIGKYFAQKDKKDNEKEYGFDYDIVATMWYIEAAKSKNNIIKARVCKELLKDSSLSNRKLGMRIYDAISDDEEAISCVDELEELVANEYLLGESVEQDLEEAFALIYYGNSKDRNILLGQMIYFGWGTDAPIEKAILYFESELRKYENLYDAREINDDFTILRVMPFLIHCYFEDLLYNSSVDSLAKLHLLAEYHGWKMAARFLYWYYSDDDNLYKDEVKAKEFKEILSKPEKTFLNIGSQHIVQILRKRTEYSLMIDNYDENRFMDLRDYTICLQSHFLVDGEENLHEYLVMDNYDMYFFLGLAFGKGNGVKVDNIRAAVYWRYYVEMTESNRNIFFYNYTKRLLDKNRIDYQEVWSKYYRKHKIIDDIEPNPEDKEIIDATIKQVVEYVRDDKLLDAAIELQGAVVRGYNGDYSMIGLQFFKNGELESAFWWAKLFYDALSDGLIFMTPNYLNICLLEYVLGLCYATGSGTETNIKNAEEYFKKAVLHAPEDRMDIVFMLSWVFYNGEAEFPQANDKKVLFDKDMEFAFKGFQRAAEGGEADAMYCLGKIYEKGELDENVDIEKAKYWYQLAADAGDEDAQNKVNELRDKL